MAKGYWIARIDVHNDGRLQGIRRAANGAVFSEIRRANSWCAAARPPKPRKAQARSRNVVLEFQGLSRQRLACYNSPEYAAKMVKLIRSPHAESRHHGDHRGLRRSRSLKA